jgi:hypothetical protein
VTPEQLLLLLAVFVLVALINVLVRALKKRFEIAGAQEAGSDAPNVPPHGRTLPAALVARGREPRGILLSTPSKPPVLSPARGRRPRVRVGSMREARRAIALIAVLGPCRGLEPPSLVGRRGERNA